MTDNETEARNIAQELQDEIRFAQARPVRPVEAIDRHLDELMSKVERLALIVARMAAGSQ